MMRIITLLQCLALTCGVATAFCCAECPTWDELLDEESVIPVRIQRGSRGAPMYVAYANPAELGNCLLGEELYTHLSGKLFEKFPDRHFFWIGGGHGMDMNEVISRTSMLQGGKEHFFDLATLLRGPRLFPGIHLEILVSFDAKLDFSESVVVFFTGFMGTYSKEYWLPEKYVEDPEKDELERLLSPGQ